MAYVIGPNGVRTYVPDDIASSLVGDGERGYAYAPEIEPAKAAAPKRTATRRARKPADS